MRGSILPTLLAAVLQCFCAGSIEAEEIQVKGATESIPLKSKWAFDQPYLIEPPDILLIDADGLNKVPAVAQVIIGEHLVGPDGKVSFGKYGSVTVNGSTLVEAKRTIEKHLSQYAENPGVDVDVLAYNSKKYYIINKNPQGDQIVTAPITGNETVLDALATIGALKGDEPKIWIDRPTENGRDRLIKLVDYQAITRGEDVSTNYQLLPCDRLFIDYREDHPTKFTKVSLRLVTDPQQNLRLIEGLQDDGSLVGESRTLKGLLGVLVKNGLSKVIASPTIAAADGKVASLKSGGKEGGQQFSVELKNRHSGKQVIFDLRFKLHKDGKISSIDTTFALDESQSYLVRLQEIDRGKDLYLLVSREPVSPPD